MAIRNNVKAATLGGFVAVMVCFAPAAAAQTDQTAKRQVLLASAQSWSEGTGAYFPNAVLQTQDGARVRFFDDLVKGKVVVINFMFTSCKNFCSRATANLVKVEEALGDHLGRDVRMISLTVDPATDTPDVLRKYSVRYGTKPGWYFVTGNQKDIDAIRKRLGAFGDDGDKEAHTGMLVYGNERIGQWESMPALARPKAIVTSIMGLLAR
jgi:protein SCO1/2